MIVGNMTVGTPVGEIAVRVELRGSGPRPGTVWIQALDGLKPFTKPSHGGPYQDDTLVVPLQVLREIHMEAGPDEELALLLPAEWLLASENSPEGRQT